MPQHQPAPEFASLAPSQRLKTALAYGAPGVKIVLAGVKSTSRPTMISSLEEARDLALKTIWPVLAQNGEEIRNRNASEEQRHRLRSTPDAWALEPWPTIPDPLWKRWLPSEALAHAAQIMACQNLLVSKGVLTHQNLSKWDPGTQEHTGIRETMGNSTWVKQALGALAKMMPLYWEDLAWTPMDLSRLWVAGCSDLGGDQMLIVHGTQEALLKASKGLVPAQFQGLPVNLVLNLQRSPESPGACSPKVGHLLLISPVSAN